MSKSNFVVRGGADFSGIQKTLAKTQKQMSSFQKKVDASMDKVAGSMNKLNKAKVPFQGFSKGIKIAVAALSSLATGKLIKDCTSMAMGVESAMDNINRNMGKYSQVFDKWVNSQSKSLGMAKSDAYKYGSTFSNLLGSFTADAKETADKTQELMKAAAIISSKTGRTYDDTANRIRSGMLGSTEAIEDLGVYTNVSMIESTEAFKKFANGKSWAKLDFQTQQQIRLAAILEQTYARYGDTLADTTQTRQAQFIASLKNVQLNLGQAFLPIYNAVLPVLTSLGNKLEQVTAKLQYFTQALFGKAKIGPAIKEDSEAVSSLGDATQSAGDAAEKAGKQAKGALAGFDELNVLADADTQGASGDISAGGGTEGVLMEAQIGEDVSVSPEIQAAADKIKKIFADLSSWFDQNLAPSFAVAWEAIQPQLDRFKEILSGIFSDVGQMSVPLQEWISSGLTPLLKQIIESFGRMAAGIWDSFNTILSDLWGKLLKPVLGSIIKNILPMLTQFILECVKTLETLFDQVKQIFDAIWKDAIAPALERIGVIWQALWDGVKKIWDDNGALVFNLIRETFTNIGDTLLNVWNSILGPVFSRLFEVIDWLWIKHIKPLWDNWVLFISDLVRLFLVLYDKLVNGVILPLINYLVEKLGPTFEIVFGTILNVVGSVIGSIADIISGLVTTLRGIITFLTGAFTGDWSKAWNGIVMVFKGIFEGIAGIVKGILNVLIDLINGMLEGIVSKINSLTSTINSASSKLGIPAIPTLSAPKIPKLATGAVIPPNAEFLAILGDQKHGRNIEAPEDLIRKIVREETGQGGSTGDLIINANGTLGQLIRLLKLELDREGNRKGTNFVQGATT